MGPATSAGELEAWGGLWSVVAMSATTLSHTG